MGPFRYFFRGMALALVVFAMLILIARCTFE
jgi:hypothetical protein